MQNIYIMYNVYIYGIIKIRALLVRYTFKYCKEWDIGLTSQNLSKVGLLSDCEVRDKYNISLVKDITSLFL